MSINYYMVHQMGSVDSYTTIATGEPIKTDKDQAQIINILAENKLIDKSKNEKYILFFIQQVVYEWGLKNNPSEPDKYFEKEDNVWVMRDYPLKGAINVK